MYVHIRHVVLANCASFLFLVYFMLCKYQYHRTSCLHILRRHIRLRSVITGACHGVEKKKHRGEVVAGLNVIFRLKIQKEAALI